MMIDQLHAFPDRATAETAFPRPEGAETAPCWVVRGATISPIVVTEITGPHPAYWLGVSIDTAEEADALWDLPTAQVELLRPEAEGTHWLSCVTRSRLLPDAASRVLGVAPLLAGSSYIF